MPKVKLTMKGFEDYTGAIGSYIFTNGISDEMSVPDAERMAGAMSVRLVIDGEVTDINPSITQKLIDIKDASAPVTPTPVFGSVETPQEEPTDAPSVAAPLSYDFTKESLEKLADAGGIPALREIANQYDVRGTSIIGLINDLVAKKALFGESQA